MRDRNVFMLESLEILNVFNTLTLKQIFWKIKTFSKKLEYRFLVQSTKIESAIFPHKTSLSEVSVKTNSIGSAQWNGVLPGTTLFFCKICVSLRISYKELIWCTNYPNFHIHTFRKRWSFIWESFFTVGILNTSWIMYRK